jgi:8-oxo-dGTP pyrophosphatase MutT (NUDIX family)
MKKEVRFALLQVAYKDRHGEDRISTVFYRPDAVGVLVVVHNKETNALYAVCVKQLRIPAGGMLIETPAGTIESDDDPVFTAIREIEEETGFTVTQENLISLGGYYLSPGACPEKMFFYACEFSFTSAEIEKLQGKNTGLEEEGEDLRLHLVPLLDLPEEAKDAKTLLAYYMYIDWKGKHLEKRSNV